MDSDCGSFDDTQLNSSTKKSADDCQPSREKLLDNVIPQIVKFQQVEQLTNQSTLNYYDHLGEYWSYNTETDRCSDFSLNLTQEEFDQIQSQKEESSSKRKAYREGDEYKKIIKDPNYNTKYDDTYLYKNLKVKTHKNVKILGKMFNADFKKQIKEGNKGLTKFPRNAERKVNVSYMFFQNLYKNEKTKDFIKSWLNARVKQLKLNSE